MPAQSFVRLGALCKHLKKKSRSLPTFLSGYTFFLLMPLTISATILHDSFSKSNSFPTSPLDYRQSLPINTRELRSVPQLTLLQRERTLETLSFFDASALFIECSEPDTARVGLCIRPFPTKLLLANQLRH